ncbi:MAG TPA: hypothetical protein VFV08_11955 [Puia sp.]|nr:hypothetical protein [Puia sp.]
MTHVYFDQDKIDWSSYLRRQQIGQGEWMEGRGGGIEGDQANPRVFRGARYVSGWGFVRNALGSIGRFLMPIASNLMQSAKSEAASTLGNIASDIAAGRSVTEAFKEQGTQGLKNYGRKVQQFGKGKKAAQKANNLRSIAGLEISNSQMPTVLTAGNIPKRRRVRKPDYLDFN